MEGLAATRWPQAEEVRIVRDLLLSLLTADVNGHRHALAVRVPDLQRGVLALDRPLLVHQAGSRVAEGQEAVVVGIEAVAVPRKGAHEELQLVVRPLADVDAQPSESVLQIVGTLVHVRVTAGHHRHAVMAVDELLALPGDDVLDVLDVLYGHLVGRTRDAAVTVALLLERSHLLLLTRHEDHLVVDDRRRLGHGVHGTHEVHRHRGVVDLDAGERTDELGERHAVHVHHGVELAAAVPEGDDLLVHLQARHRDGRGGEVEGEVTVHVVAGFLLVQEPADDARVLELVADLADLHHEVPPLAGVVGEELAALALLRDHQVGEGVGVLPAREIAEIAVGEELPEAPLRILEPPAAENVLLVQGVSLTQGLGEGGQQGSELVVRVDVRGVLLHGILHLEDGGVVAVLRVEDADALHLLDGEVDVLEDPAALAAGPEGEHRDGHPDQDRRENEYDVEYHCSFP